MTLKQPLIAGMLINSGDTGFVVPPWRVLGNYSSRKPCLGFARSAYATRIYAKVDLAGLREVANFELGGLL
jgi:hypothetical protein